MNTIAPSQSVLLTKRFVFHAAHQTPTHPQLHGHGFQVELVVQGAVHPQFGWVEDYGDIKRVFKPLYQQLDHAYLNQLGKPLGTTQLPDISQWITQQLQPQISGLVTADVTLPSDLAFTPCLTPATFHSGREALPERIQFSFEAAHHLPKVPTGHPCGRIHGHSYRIEIGGLDLDMNQQALSVLYDHLDHRYLNEVSGLENPTAENLCAWVWQFLCRHAQTPSVVVVAETDSSSAVYRGNELDSCPTER